ncbi:hypothetical protein ACX80D_03335 [Arthrobacter sp. Sr24]
MLLWGRVQDRVHRRDGRRAHPWRSLDCSWGAEATPDPFALPVIAFQNQQFPNPQNQQGQQSHNQQFQQNLAAPAPADGWGQQSSAAQADDEAGENRARPQGARIALRLSFDDGSTEDLAARALSGPHSASYDGEMISRLISIHDSTRSVSKTHRHLRAAAEGLWVTDRHSTKAGALSVPNGAKSPLVGGSPAVAESGSWVHFGHSSFLVEKA